MKNNSSPRLVPFDKLRGLGTSLHEMERGECSWLNVGSFLHRVEKGIKGMRIGFWILILVISLTGCAKTVTQIVSYGSQMTVEITLRGNFDAAVNRYFLVLGSGSNLAVPLPPPDNITYEMLEPGDTPVQGDVADYYSTYYDTWAGYIIIDPGGYYLVKGPFVQDQTNTREAIANLGDPNNKLSFDFNLSKIFGNSVPDQIYFDFVSVAWPDGQEKLPSDHLSATNPYISKLVGSIKNIDNGDDTSVDAVLDITRCDVEIQ